MYPVFSSPVLSIYRIDSRNLFRALVRDPESQNNQTETSFLRANFLQRCPIIDKRAQWLVAKDVAFNLRIEYHRILIVPSTLNDRFTATLSISYGPRSNIPNLVKFSVASEIWERLIIATIRLTELLNSSAMVKALLQCVVLEITTNR